VRQTAAVLLARHPGRTFVADDVVVGTIDLPELTPGTALVRNQYMSLDPSTRGRMDPGEKQYTTNFELGGPLDGSAIGIVEESASDLLPVGATVRHRLGWREYAVVDDSLATVSVCDLGKAPAISWLSSMGQTGFTAYAGLLPVGQLAAGETVLVTGAGGAVGSMAGQFARLLGAGRVVGSAGGAEKCAWLMDECGFDAVINYRDADFAAELPPLAPDGIDLFFDNVGGWQFAAALHNMKIKGRISMCGAVSNFGTQQQPSTAVLMEVVLRRLTVQGFIIRDFEALRPEFEERVSGWLASGDLVDRATVVEGLANAGAGLAGLLSGANVGKALVRLSD
jgi:NADPH-dependent curcumin reductase CurA